jgi:hypothetical protein
VLNSVAAVVGVKQITARHSLLGNSQGSDEGKNEGWDTGIREWESWGERGRVGCAGDGDLSVEVVRSWLIL